MQALFGVKMRLVLSAVAAWFLFCACETANVPCGTGTLAHFDGKWYFFTILEHDLAVAPSWEPEKTPRPPLDPGEAVTRAQTKLKELFPDLQGWKLAGVDLASSWSPNYWYYQVQFQPPGPAMKVGQSVEMFSIVVLMDGRVVDPEVKADSGERK